MNNLMPTDPFTIAIKAENIEQHFAVYLLLVDAVHHHYGALGVATVVRPAARSVVVILVPAATATTAAAATTTTVASTRRDFVPTADERVVTAAARLRTHLLTATVAT